MTDIERRYYRDQRRTQAKAVGRLEKRLDRGNESHALMKKKIRDLEEGLLTTANLVRWHEEFLRSIVSVDGIRYIPPPPKED